MNGSNKTKKNNNNNTFTQTLRKITEAQPLQKPNESVNNNNNYNNNNNNNNNNNINNINNNVAQQNKNRVYGANFRFPSQDTFSISGNDITFAVANHPEFVFNLFYLFNLICLI